MTTVADASPLIFLAKLDSLSLLPRVLGKEILVPRQVRDEVLAPDVDPAEFRHLEGFLASCEVVAVRPTSSLAAGLSAADRAALALAMRRKADVLLCDDRLLRSLADAEGIRPLGTLGVLLQAARTRVVPPARIRRAIEDLVGRYGFRIRIEVYQHVLRELDSMTSS